MTETAQVIDMKRKGSMRGFWKDLEPLLAQIRQIYGCTQHDALQLMGYSGSTLVADWRDRNGPPTTAIMAAKGVLAEAHWRPKGKKPAEFEFNELSQLFAVLMNISIPEEQRQDLVKKIAGYMASLEKSA